MRLDGDETVTQTLWLTLPAPPSVNNLYATAESGRRKTEAVRRWESAAGWEAKIQLIQAPSKTIRGKYDLSIYLPQFIKGDIDNRVKAVSDLLVRLRITEDDKGMVHLMICRAYNVPSGRAFIVVRTSVGIIECPWSPDPGNTAA